MNHSLKERLFTISQEKLIDLIFELAGDSDVSWSKIQRLVSKPRDNSDRFIRRLDELKSRKGFVPWKYSSDFAEEVSDVLADLDAGIDSPEEGFSLICEFYKTDAAIFENADDSSGHIGDIFSGSALDIFIKFASKVSNKKMVIRKTLELIKDDDYGVRGVLIKHAGEFLSETDLRELFNLIESEHKEEKGRGSSWKSLSIAKQLKDAPLFESLVRRENAEPNSRMLIEVADVYFLSGSISKAQEILNTIQKSDHFASFEQERLQKQIYSSLGNTEELFKIVYDAFKRNFSEYTLKDLLDVAGENKRSQFLKEAKEKILASSKWSSHDAEFLAFIEAPDSLDKYVLEHKFEIQGGIFYSSASIAEYLATQNKFLAAIVLYRGLIAETLKKAIAKYYHHVVGYLEILDKISPNVQLWDDLEDHCLYLQNLKKKHALKKSLWARYKL